jgi:hypothetical protein
MGEKIPERKLPEFKISKEQAERLRTVSAITKILADDPELTKNIANEFVKAFSSGDPIPAHIIMRDKISRMIADKVKDLGVDRVVELYPYWYRFIVRYWMPHIHYWDWEYYIGPRTERRI